MIKSPGSQGAGEGANGKDWVVVFAPSIYATFFPATLSETNLINRLLKVSTV